jgi:hypothetical protein
MTAFDYTRALATANRLIERYGKLGAVRREGEATGPVYDPTPGEPDDHPARFAIVEFEADEIDGTRILSTDKKALVAPGTLPIDILPSDLLVEADETVWNIVPPVGKLRPATTTLLYTLQVRA